MLSLAQAEQALNLVDKAAAQNDRWLFLASLVLLLCFAGFVIKWLVAHISEKDAAIVEKEQRHEKDRAAAEVRHDASRAEARTEFLKALAEQRADFRAELQTERAAVVSSLTRLAELTMEHVKEARTVWRMANPNIKTEL